MFDSPPLQWHSIVLREKKTSKLNRLFTNDPSSDFLIFFQKTLLFSIFIYIVTQGLKFHINGFQKFCRMTFCKDRAINYFVPIHFLKKTRFYTSVGRKWHLIANFPLFLTT